MVKKLIILAVILTGVFLAWYFNLHQYLTLENLKNNKDSLDRFYSENQLLMLAGYFLVYILVVTLQIPGALIMTLAGGALFGLTTGTILISFASSIGATLAFLVARMLLGETLQNKYSKKLKSINEGVEKEGAYYLLTLRLIPVFPFFLINLLMGITKMSLWQFYIISQIGMLPGTILYVNAGTALYSIEQPSDIMSPRIWGSFIALGLFPLIVKKILKYLKKNSEISS